MDEQELFTRYAETHDKELRNEIVEKNLYIAAMIAKKFVGRGVEYDDLYQVASLALMKGLDRFEPQKGVKFSTFITPTIAGEIKNYFRDRSRLVHLPRRVSELRAQIKRHAEKILAETGSSPTTKELARFFHVSEEEIVSAMEAGVVVSLDKPPDEDDGASFLDVLPAHDESFEQIEQRDVVQSALKTLTKEERAILEYRYGRELSQMETAKLMKVSQMYISRMERKILEKLRMTLKKNLAE